jgi:hypothetical protein
MILFTTVDNIILETRVHTPEGIKIEQYEHTPFASTLKNDLKQGLGGYYMRNLRKPNRVIAYKEYTTPPTEEDLFSQMTYITYLFSIAWYQKFNSFQIGDIWYYDKNKKTLLRIGFGHTASPPAGIKGEAVFFSNNEIDSSIRFLDTFISFNFPAKFDLTLGDTDYTNISVLQRAAELIELSKLTPNTYHKIGLLCSALECLFTTDATEVTHKVSERAAFFLSDTTKERIIISQKIKTAYSQRSKFFHGGKLKNIANDTFFDIDEIVRRTMVKALTEKAEIFMGSQEQLNKYFTDLIFGRA